MNNFIRIIKNIIAPLVLIGAFLSIQNCNSVPKRNTVEIITTTACWSSPCWGYNAPKIVRNSHGHVWVINMYGSYPSSKAQIFRKCGDSGWEAGKIFDAIYQPGMIFLDQAERLNVVFNSQTEPVKHYRSMDSDNLHNFELIANGNGLDDGRGWYVGIGIHENRIYMAYITLDYDFWLTWKELQDTAWHPAVLVYDGFPDPNGNHSLLYPKFQFNEDTAFIMSSHTSDGSTYNTYDKIILNSFPVHDPKKVTSEVVFEGDSGYYSFGFDMILGNDGAIYCAYSAGEHKYGPVIEDALPSGLYLSVKHPGEDAWQHYQIHDKMGCVALHISEQDELFAVVTQGSWFSENQTLLKKSSDHGKTWSVIRDNLFSGMPEINHQYFLQTIQKHSGSSVQGIQALFSNMHKEKTADSLYTFDLMYLQSTEK